MKTLRVVLAVLLVAMMVPSMAFATGGQTATIGTAVTNAAETSTNGTEGEADQDVIQSEEDADQTAVSKIGDTGYSLKAADDTREQTEEGAGQTEAVCKIGDTSYDSLDAAVQDVADGGSIELLTDCTLTKTFQKSITFKGTGKITLKTGRWDYTKGKELSFDGKDVQFDFTSTATGWLQMCLGGKLNVKNGASCILRFDSESVTGTTPNCAIYMNAGSEINVENGSAFQILGKNTKGVAGQAIQLDQTGKAVINVKSSSSFLIDGTNRGYVNSPVIHVEDSVFTVQNCTNNASNGGIFTAKNSKIKYLNNCGHGLSTTNATIENTEMTIQKNGYCGFANTGELSIDGSSKLHINENGWNNLNGQAALRQGGCGLVKKGAVVDITDNYCTGLYLNKAAANVTVEDGVDLDIKNNGRLTDEGRRLTTTGGGIWNQGTLTVPADAEIYNNHAATAGDDIYNADGASITFGPVGNDWTLDGDPDCKDAIDGWYDDASNDRWKAHGKKPYHVEEFTEYKAAVAGLKALKAAHGLLPVSADDPDAQKWAISKSKEAENLDENFESQVTLSLPASSYKGDLDVAFVLDGSTSADEQDLAQQAAALLDDLAAYKNLNVKASLTVFGGAVPALENTDLMEISKEDNLNELKSKLTDPSYDKKTGRSGSNLQAGIELAKEKLANDKEVAASDKYMIVLSDGAARMWYEKGEAYSQTYLPNNTIFWNSNEDFLHRYPESNSSACRTFGRVWSDGQGGKEIGAHGMTEAEKDVAGTDNEKIASWETVANDPDYYTTYEAATYYAATSIVEASKEEHIIFVSYPYHPDKKFGQYIESFKSWLAQQGYVTRYDNDSMSETDIFESVKDDLIQLVDKGSVVVDEIGNDKDSNGNAYNFNFVNDIEKLDLTVGGKLLKKEKINDTSYGFGKQENGSYQFVVEYYKDGLTYKGTQYGECFLWKINVPVTIDKAVQLKYTVELTDPQTAKGTYGEYDKDGSKKYDGLYTNNQAVLYPVDSQNQEGLPELFGKPTVSYTVTGQTVDPTTPVDPTDPGTTDPGNDPGTTNPGSDSGSDAEQVDGAAKTGDDSNMGWALLVMMLSAAGIAVCARKLWSR